MAAGNTYTQIASTTLGSAASSVTFSSIPSTYTDLVLVYNGKFASASGQIGLQFNGDTATNYSNTSLQGDGTSATSARDSSAARMLLGYTATTSIDNMTIIQVMNYSNATTYKTAMARHNTAGSANVQATVGLWRSTLAINQILLLCYNGINFTAGSTFNLYGITAA